MYFEYNWDVYCMLRDTCLRTDSCLEINFYGQQTGIVIVQKLFGDFFLMCTASLLSWPSLTIQDDAVNII